MWHNNNPAVEVGNQNGLMHWIAPAMIFAGCVLLYALNLDRFPFHDELYHILAARSMLLTGEPIIAEGIYERVLLYTWMVAKLFGFFGESLAVSRLPSVLAISAVAALMFIWLRKVADTRAALIGSLLFAISPFAVETALFTRFYALQTLCFFIGALLLYATFEGTKKYRRYYPVIAIVPLLGAVYFQSTSLIGLTAICAWIALRLVSMWIHSTGEERTKLNKIGLTLIGSATLVLVTLISTGYWQHILSLYTNAPLFSESKANKFWIYLVYYLQNYPTLWPAIGLITIAALAHRNKPALFACVCFVVSLVLTSLAAAKGLRYIIYAQPFVFILFGIGISAIMGPALTWLRSVHGQLASRFPVRRRLASFFSTALLSAAISVLVLANPAVARSLSFLGDFSIPPDRPRTNWMAAYEDIKPWLEDADIVVTMQELELLYYYGRYDILFSASRLAEIPEGVDFDPDYRTGRPVIQSAQAVQQLFDCYSKGIFVTNRLRWRHPDYIPTPIANLIVTKTTQLELPQASQVLAFTWENSSSESGSEDCSALSSAQLAKAH